MKYRRATNLVNELCNEFSVRLYRRRWRVRPCMFGLCLTLMITQGCDVNDAKVVNAFADAFGAILSDKKLVEQMVTDVKNSAISPKAYSTIETDYNNARASYNTYLDAIRVAVVNGQATTDLSLLTKPVKANCQKFLSRGASTIDQRSQVPTVECSPPGNLHTLLTKLPKKDRLEAIDRLTDQLRWGEWQDIGRNR